MFCTRRQQIARGIRNRLQWVRAQQTANKLNREAASRFCITQQVSGGKLVYVVRKQGVATVTAEEAFGLPIEHVRARRQRFWVDLEIALVTESKEEAEALACQPI